MKIIYISKKSYYGIESPEECPFHGRYGEYCDAQTRTKCCLNKFPDNCPLEEGDFHS